MSLKSEIFEQPAILTRLIKDQLNEVGIVQTWLTINCI
jgi:hypothetical protein